MKKIIKILAVLIVLIAVTSVTLRIIVSINDNKFYDVEDHVPIDDLKKDWGEPDIELNCNNCSGDKVIMYNRDILRWSKYTFIYDSKDKILIEKVIDE